MKTADRPEPAANGRVAVGGLTPKQEQAALAIAAGATDGEAAKASGAGSRTIRTWRATIPEFKGRVNELRAAMTDRALGKLVDNMASAADTLGYLTRKAKQEAVRLGAARALLELGVKLKDSIELEARIAELERGKT